MSCSPAPDAPSVACIAGTATLTMLTSRAAIIWPARTRVRATAGEATRSRRTGARTLVVRSVMTSSVAAVLCWYQEPGYPGTDTTCQVRGWYGRMRLVSTTAGSERRTELAAFLPSRRERISPEDVGLPPGARRRTAGLRREELAQLAGVGVTWYTWLEQGRPINVSVQVLDAVARTLMLDQVERAHLFRLAEVPGVASAGAVEKVLPDAVQDVLDALPIPACV